MTRYLRARRNIILAEPRAEQQTEYVPRTEHEEARRDVRDWLRDRDENDVDEFEQGLAGPITN